MIKIILPDREGLKTCVGTRVFSGDKEIKEVSSIKIHLENNRILTGTFEIAIDSIENMDNIYALLGVDTLEKIAAMHNYKLERIAPLDNRLALPVKK